MKSKDIIKKYKTILKSLKIETFHLDSLLLLQFVSGYSKEEIIIYNPLINEKLEKEYAQLIDRRAKFEPVAYILGNKEFYSLDFKVDKRVLIPRVETEIIVEEALKRYRQDQKISILDIGTGSGCIIITILKQMANSLGCGIDISKDAINLAKENAEKHGVLERLEFEKIDIEKFLTERKFDLVVSNPPYIDLKQYENLAKNVKDYEPKIALTDNDSGYKFYEIIAEKSKEYIKKNGVIIIEFGIGQSAKIKEIFESENWLCEKIIKDLANIDRVACFINS